MEISVTKKTATYQIVKAAPDILQFAQSTPSLVQK